MRVLSFPEDVSIGGLEAQADRLADDAARTAEEAEALVLSLLRGDRLWLQPRPVEPLQTAAFGPRRVA